MASVWTLKGKIERVERLLSLPENSSVRLVTEIDDTFKMSGKTEFFCEKHGNFTRQITQMQNKYICVKCREESLSFLGGSKVKKNCPGGRTNMRGAKIKERVDSLLAMEENKNVSLVSKLNGADSHSDLEWKCSVHGSFTRKLVYITNTGNKTRFCICSRCHGGSGDRKQLSKRGDSKGCGSEVRDAHFKVERKKNECFVKKLSSELKDGYMVSNLNKIYDGVLGSEVVLSRFFAKAFKDNELSKIYSDLMREIVKIKDAYSRVDRYYKSYLEDLDA